MKGSYRKNINFLKTTFIIVLIIFISGLAFTKDKKFKNGTLDLKKPLIPSTYNSQIANVWTRLTNFGYIGDDSFNNPSFEWPGGSGNHYLYKGSIWIAAKDPAGVIHCTAGDKQEFYWTWDENDVIRFWAEDDPHFQNRPNVDPSSNGKQVSAEDTYCDYMDINIQVHNPGQSPLGIKVIERTYKWDTTNIYDFIIFDFQIINIGLDSDQDGEPDTPQKLTELYVAIRIDADISYLAGGEYWYDDLVGYDSTHQLSYMFDGDDPDRPGNDEGEDGVSPGYIYARMLKASGGTPNISYTNPVSHIWWTIDNDPRTDSLKFAYMSTPGYSATPDSTYDYRFLQTAGPFTMEPDDTVNIVWSCGVGAGLDTIILDSDYAKQIFDNGFIVPSTGGIVNSKNEEIPETYTLYHAYPNPFNPLTKIKFSLPKPETVRLEVYNIIGQRIKTLLNKSMPAGNHEVEFNGQSLSSGIYLYKIEAGAWQDVNKMVLLR